jgi:hypothetical protein
MTEVIITKKQLLDAALKGKGPLGRAADDEPVFLLRAQDCLAADFVDKWAIQASLLVPVAGAEATGHKVGVAHQIADFMRRWPIHKNPD